MQYRLTNSAAVVRLADGAVIPDDQGNADWLQYQQWLDAGGVPDPVPALSPEQQQDACVAAIQAELDRRAQAKGYDDIVSACSYAAQAPGAPFQAEGAAFLAWRSAVWQQAYSAQAAVKAGAQPLPTPAQAVAAMPPLELP